MVMNCLQKAVQRLEFALSSPKIARAMNPLQIAFNYLIPLCWNSWHVQRQGQLRNDVVEELGSLDAKDLGILAMLCSIF